MSVILKAFALGMCFCLVMGADAWGAGTGGKILLRDVQVLTLKHGQMTNGRRSTPVPQLACVGGSAGCSTFTPQVVQCYNRGTDGRDIQWECKTDMDELYRFGTVEVNCEGFEYPDDPFILVGSCGLEYTIDYTKAGYEKTQHNYYGEKAQHTNTRGASSWSKPGLVGFKVNDLIILGIVCIIIYAVYKICIASPAQNYPGSTPHSGPTYPGSSPHSGPSAPPPYGFKPEYTAENQGPPPAYGSTFSSPWGASAPPRVGGFWSGMATGGLMGYLFGSRTNTQYPQHQYAANPSPWGSSWGTGQGSRSNFWTSTPSGAGASASTGTRTASGFGGTKRR